MFPAFHCLMAFCILHAIINEILLHTTSYHKLHTLQTIKNCELLLTASNQKWQAIIVSCKLSKTAYIAYYKIPKWKAIQIMKTARLQAIKRGKLLQDIKTRSRHSDKANFSLETRTSGWSLVVPTVSTWRFTMIWTKQLCTGYGANTYLNTQ